MAKYDLVLYGATGFTGKLVANYLARHPSGDQFSWAIAGRNPKKLAELKASLPDRGDGPGVVVADASDAASISSMVSATRVVITTAGPYGEYHGETLVECCARTGTDYADLSGEYWWQRRMIDEFHDEAQRTGAKIVTAAGVDSIPSDLGTQFAIERLAEAGARATQVKALYTDYAGSFSWGTAKTLAAGKNVTESGEYDEAFYEDPYVLAPEANVQGGGETVTGWDHYRFDRDFKTFGGPFYMAPINARVVRRSLALNGHLPCSYKEGISLGAWLKPGWLFISRGFGYFVGAPVRLRPKPGEGPPAWLQRAGKFRVLIRASSETGAESVTVEVKGRGDPGYGATSRMLAEVGLCLALDREKLPAQSGVLTPATALGAPLRERLGSVEGGEFMQFRVIDQ
jgi:short subunit dehydrogenase-like uncharacterized protein